MPSRCRRNNKKNVYSSPCFHEAQVMANHQKIHPTSIASPSTSSPVLARPDNFYQSDKSDPSDHYPPFQRTIPVSISTPPKRTGCCKFLLVIIVFIVLIAITAAVLYIIFDPKAPTYTVDSLQMSAFRIGRNLTAVAKFNVTITATNPNKMMAIYYEEGSHLTAWYADTSLCNGSFPVFRHGHRNVTVLRVVMTGETVLASGLLSALQQQGGMIPLTVAGDVPVRVKFGKMKIWRMTARARCNLVVKRLNARNQISIRSSSCKFKFKM